MGDYPFGPGFGFERDTDGVYEPTSKRKWRMGTRIHTREPCTYTCTYTYTYAFSLKLASRSSLPTSSSTLIATAAAPAPAPTASGNECAASPSAFCA